MNDKIYAVFVWKKLTNLRSHGLETAIGVVNDTAVLLGTHAFAEHTQTMSVWSGIEQENSFECMLAETFTEGERKENSVCCWETQHWSSEKFSAEKVSANSM